MESIWSQSCKIAKRDHLPGSLEVETVVIGAGMAGVLTAFALQQAGCQVAVLEANQIGSGQTQNTTAKITAQHGMIYQTLIQTMGRDGARQYAQANQSAVDFRTGPGEHLPAITFHRPKRTQQKYRHNFK